MSPAGVRVRTSYRSDPIAACQDRLIAHLVAAVGPALPVEEARVTLEQAKVWRSLPMRQLDQHLAAYPDALRAPDPHAPKALFRLIYMLHAAGFREAVTLPRCPGRGRVAPDWAVSGRPHPDGRGRCCRTCIEVAERVRCVRCGQLGRATARRPEGVICDNCYWRDSARQQQCAGCGRLRRPSRRTDQGLPLCQTCAPTPTHRCVECGRSAKTAAITEAGRVCRRCYRQPERRCGRCGRLRPINRRARGEDPDLCYSCVVPPAEQCVVCGRVRPCRTGPDGAARCDGCRPRPRRACAGCGRSRATCAYWPMGPVCSTCYTRAIEYPGRCATCGQVRALVDRSREGQGLCGSCAVHRVARDPAGGRGRLEFICRSCGAAATYYAGRCAGCVVVDRVTDLLGGEDGTVPDQLLPFADALVTTAPPRQLLKWLLRSPAARFLAELAAGGEPVTHQRLDRLPQPIHGGAVTHLRKLLVATGVLPQRLERLARLESWLEAQLADRPPAHRLLVRPFAQWVVLRKARHDAGRGRYTHGSLVHDREQIRHALLLLSWLHQRGLTITDLTQAHLDRWMTEGARNRRTRVRAFVSWTAARKITPELIVARQNDDTPSRFLAEGHHLELLQLCLTDQTTMPLDVRVAGALILLYGLRATKVASLTADRLTAGQAGTYLTIDKLPVLLPPNLASLMEQHLVQHHRRLGRATRFLFPGRPSTEPIAASSLAARLRRYGIPAGAARNTALMTLAAELPARVIADLFGLAPKTATAWSLYAQADWTAYLTSGPSLDPSTPSG